MAGTRYVAWLHAVNVGGRNKVPMAWLRDASTAAGFRDVATYVQSGNLVVTADTNKAKDVREQVAGLIRDGLGLDVEVSVRSSADLEKVIARNPMAEHVDEPAKLHVSFLTGKPDLAGATAIDAEKYEPDRFVIDGEHLYLWFPGGAGRSKLAALPWRKRIGVAGTARNWRTVLAVLELMAAG
ncbi:MAG TPA: DUF1697 domain-containing protein [Mycobacteriales bacterium]|jgi:uncharacterized protein (DUF1697 family)|nr:DUF1697 domain-containing protein [Mycobacteriales bacterium]